MVRLTAAVAIIIAAVILMLGYGYITARNSLSCQLGQKNCVENFFIPSTSSTTTVLTTTSTATTTIPQMHTLTIFSKGNVSVSPGSYKTSNFTIPVKALTANIIGSYLFFEDGASAYVKPDNHGIPTMNGASFDSDPSSAVGLEIGFLTPKQYQEWRQSGSKGWNCDTYQNNTPVPGWCPTWNEYYYLTCTSTSNSVLQPDGSIKTFGSDYYTQCPMNETIFFVYPTTNEGQWTLSPGSYMMIFYNPGNFTDVVEITNQIDVQYSS